MKVYELIATKVEVFQHLKKLDKPLEEVRAEIQKIERNFLPSGSGFDLPPVIDLVRSTKEQIIISADFHAMNDQGFYIGWIPIELTLSPAFTNFSLEIHLNISPQDDADFEHALDFEFFTDFVHETYISALLEPASENYHLIAGRIIFLNEKPLTRIEHLLESGFSPYETDEIAKHITRLLNLAD